VENTLLATVSWLQEMQSRPSLLGYCREPDTCMPSTNTPLLSLRVKVHRAELAKDTPEKVRPVDSRATWSWCATR
jgi:hypothetical protein